MDDDLIFRKRQPKAGKAAPVGQSTSSSSSGAWWSIPVLCFGLGMIAWCVLIPASNANRKLVLEREKLQRDLAAVDKQIAVNDEFLKRVSGDPELSERLAQRQMKFIREGTNVLELQKPTAQQEQMSPFLLTAMPKPAPLLKWPRQSGPLGRLAEDGKMQLYLIGMGLLLLAGALVMGGSTTKPADVR